MVDSKENGKFDLGVEGLKCPGVYINQQGKDNCSSFFPLMKYFITFSCSFACHAV